MKRFTCVLLAAFVLGMLFTAFWPDDVLGANRGSDRKGKYFYKKYCRKCHGKDVQGGELTPMSKTQAQWEEFFKKGRHKDQKLTDVVDEKMLIHIQTFLMNHAADSDQPETCG